VKNWLRKEAEKYVDPWMTEVLGNLPPVTASLRKALLKDYREEYDLAMSQRVRDLAREKAIEDAENLFKEACETVSNFDGEGLT
jgi:hypothetical protein